MKIRVHTKMSSATYRVEVQPGLLGEVGDILHRQWPSRKVIVLTNNTVHKLWFATLQRSLRRSGIIAPVIKIRDGEKYKNLKTFTEIFTGMQDHHADRHTVLLAFGGGIVGDLGGFVAATYMRGIDLVHVPTTLVAQIDASIGGKTAVDLPQAKNTIGSFYNPRFVLSDPDVLSTLTDRELRNGLFEAIKTALVTDRKFYSFIVKNCTAILQRSPRVLAQLVIHGAREKAKIVNHDPYDRNLRAVLNFGHTVGHALEAVGRYRRIKHGEAVGWGMLVALRLTRFLGLNSWPENNEVEVLIRRLLPKRQWDRLDPDELWQTMKLDKKVKDGVVHFVLLKDIARPVFAPVTKRIFVRAWREL